MQIDNDSNDGSNCKEENDRRLHQEAVKYLQERNINNVLDELGFPVIRTLSNEILPHISEAVLQNEDEEIRIDEVTPCNIGSADVNRKSISEYHRTLDTKILSSGCDSIDRMLLGGIPKGCGIVEISGKAGSGKTQLSIHLALMCNAPVTHGGLNEACILVHTEGPPPIKRMISLDQSFCNRFGLTNGTLLKRIIVEQIGSADELLHWTQYRLPYLIRKTGAKMIAIDSIAALYRSDFVETLPRDSHLLQTVAQLRKCVDKMNGICICVNQVSQKPDPVTSQWKTVPALGQAWSHCLSTRIFLSRKRENSQIRTAEITHSSYLKSGAMTRADFQILETGLQSVD